jgi:hypothetical protein
MTVQEVGAINAGVRHVASEHAPVGAIHEIPPGESSDGHPGEGREGMDPGMHATDAPAAPAAKAPLDLTKLKI